MAATGADGTFDEASARKAESQTSDEYETTQAEPAPPAALSQEASTVLNDPSIGISQIDAPVPDPTSQSTFNNPLAAATPTGLTTHHSQSRSMSRASSSSSLNEQMITTSEMLQNVPQGQGGSGIAAPVSNGVLLQNPTLSSSLPVDNASSSRISLDHNAQRGVVSNATLNAVPDRVLPATDASPLEDSSTPANEKATIPTVPDTISTSHQQSNTPSVTIPKARLPHDKIGILEDRIKDDARGDIDAWTSLIEEHKRRGKLEDARSVYERFFDVFPFAVRCAQEATTVLNNHANLSSRLKSGFLMPKWRMKHRIDMHSTKSSERA